MLQRSALLAVMAVALPLAHAVTIPLITRNAVWKYWDNATAPSDDPMAWTGSSFDDTAWGSGPAMFGYGDKITAKTMIGKGNGIVTYFRSSFFIADPAGFVFTILSTIDDGAVLYINGVEAWRNNMRPGVATNTSLASSAIGNDASVKGPFVLPAAMVTPGTNFIAVSVHQESATSSDMRFALSINADITQAGISRMTTQVLVPLGDSWRYLDTNTYPVDHMRPTYVDTAWKIGKAPLGWGDGDEATVVAKGITTLFHRRFTLAAVDPKAFIVEAFVVADDGAAVYLNGVEGSRRENMPATNPLTGTTFALTAKNPPAENALSLEAIYWAISTLVVGPNLVAVEVHQDGSTRTQDMSFDLRMTLRMYAAPASASPSPLWISPTPTPSVPESGSDTASASESASLTASVTKTRTPTATVSPSIIIIAKADTSSGGGAKTTTIGIAVGVVLGVVVIGAAASFLVIRNRKQQQARKALSKSPKAGAGSAGGAGKPGAPPSALKPASASINGRTDAKKPLLSRNSGDSNSAAADVTAEGGRAKGAAVLTAAPADVIISIGEKTNAAAPAAAAPSGSKPAAAATAAPAARRSTPPTPDAAVAQVTPLRGSDRDKDAASTATRSTRAERDERDRTREKEKEKEKERADRAARDADKEKEKEEKDKERAAAKDKERERERVRERERDRAEKEKGKERERSERKSRSSRSKDRSPRRESPPAAERSEGSNSPGIATVLEARDEIIQEITERRQRRKEHAKKMIMAAVLQNGGVPDASGGVSPRARRSASPRTMALAAAGAGGAEDVEGESPKLTVRDLWSGTRPAEPEDPWAGSPAAGQYPMVPMAMPQPVPYGYMQQPMQPMMQPMQPMMQPMVQGSPMLSLYQQRGSVSPSRRMPAGAARPNVAWFY